MSLMPRPQQVYRTILCPRSCVSCLKHDGTIHQFFEYSDSKYYCIARSHYSHITFIFFPMSIVADFRQDCAYTKFIEPTSWKLKSGHSIKFLTFFYGSPQKMVIFWGVLYFLWISLFFTFKKLKKILNVPKKFLNFFL